MPVRKPAKNYSTYQSHFPDTENPFLTDMADELWATIEQKGTPVSKEELLRRAEVQKRHAAQKRKTA